MLAAERDTVRQVTVRLPERLLRRAKATASRRRVSLNALLRQALERMADEEREAVLSAAYDALGEDADSDASGFLKAQAEVVRRG